MIEYTPQKMLLTVNRLGRTIISLRKSGRRRRRRSGIRSGIDGGTLARTVGACHVASADLARNHEPISRVYGQSRCGSAVPANELPAPMSTVPPPSQTL